MIEANVEDDSLGDLAFASRKPPEFMHHRLVQCPVCDLLYASPAPAAERLAGAYESAGFDSEEEARFASQTYSRLSARVLSQVPAHGRALDIGTGDGAFLRELLARGMDPDDVVGVEPSAAPIAAADPAVRPLIRQGIFSADDFEPGAVPPRHLLSDHRAPATTHESSSREPGASSLPAER